MSSLGPSFILDSCHFTLNVLLPKVPLKKKNPHSPCISHILLIPSYQLSQVFDKCNLFSGAGEATAVWNIQFWVSVDRIIVPCLSGK